MSGKAKSRHVAQVSIENFFLRHKTVWFLTFTEPGRVEGTPYWTKDEAEEHFKPFRDLCRRRGVEMLVVWERQQRGAWHPHCLVSKRLDVNEIRPFMVERGWGRIMKFLCIPTISSTTYSKADLSDAVTEKFRPGAKNLIFYLTKYLTKSLESEEGCVKKKLFGASQAARAGGVSFKWAPWVRPGAMLFAAGLEFFVLMNQRPPRFKDMMEVIRCGVEATDWASVDPLWEFGFPSRFG